MIVCPNCGVELDLSEVTEVCTNCGIPIPSDLESPEGEADEGKEQK